MTIIVIICLLTGCNCQGRIDTSETNSPSIGDVTEIDVINPSEPILPSGSVNWSEGEREWTLYIMNATGFDAYRSLGITKAMDEIGIKEISECVVENKEKSSSGRDDIYTVRIMDDKGKVYYFMLDSSVFRVHEDSPDGKCIWLIGLGYNPDGWDDSNILTQPMP